MYNVSVFFYYICFMITTVKDRAFNAINLKQFDNINNLDVVGKHELVCPHDDQYILRMLIKKAYGDVMLPDELEWIRPMVEQVLHYQTNVLGVNHMYLYATVRHGIVRSQTDDVWHVDGFSTKITHIPEQNYIISNVFPTEYVEKAFPFPNDFDPLKHNVHMYFQDRIEDSDIKLAEPHTIYCMDPYVVHRRPDVPDNIVRTFVRLSFTPIEIMDDNNTPNPFIPVEKYNRDGVIIRNTLIKY